MHTTTLPASRNAVTVRLRRRDRRISTVVSGMTAPYPARATRIECARVLPAFFHPQPVDGITAGQTDSQTAMKILSTGFPTDDPQAYRTLAQPFHRFFHKPSQPIRIVR